MTKPEILIIEDSKTFAEYLSDVISKENYKTTIAITGKQGLDSLKKFNYNLVLLDMELPDCTGIDILKSIRLTHNQTELPVIFISATTDEHKIIESLEYGGNDFISKPFSEITLKIKIKNLLQLQHSSMQLAANLKIQEEQNIQLQKLADELSQMNKDKDLFISILVHDLKNPFNALLGLTDVLLLNFPEYTKEKIEKQIKLINKVSYQTYNLLESLILWSKSQAGRIPFEPQKINLSEICNEIVGDMNFQADAKKIKLNINNDKDIVIMADLNMLKTILRNLISNAIKFTNINGEIKIYTEQTNSLATIIVSDNGVGIDKKNLSQIFASPNLYTTKGTAEEKGTGLGLLLCKDFVEKHKGKIWVESELGKGSNFKFTMPLFVD
jgi:two-component system, sensor histidine kinase and response regulator